MIIIELFLLKKLSLRIKFIKKVIKPNKFKVN